MNSWKSSSSAERTKRVVGDRSLVLDANILIRAVLGRRARRLIQQYSPEVSLFAPDTAFLEAEEHLARLRAERGLPEKETQEIFESVSAIVQEWPAPGYSKYEAEARARIERLDPDDWPVLAAALALNCPIWTEDKHFFGVGVPTWTTDRVELFLANKKKPKLEEIKPIRED
jgi:predicted nucleic acid-binding protein